MEVKFSELPEWAQEKVAETLGARKRPRSHIEYVTEVKMGGVWHDSCRRYVFARSADGREVGYHSAYYDSILNSTPSEIAMWKGGTTVLPSGGMMVEILTYPQTVRCYIHVDQAPKEITTKEVELSEQEGIALEVLSGIKSGYRIEELRKCGIGAKQANELYRQLVEKGFAKVDGRGAQATVEGREYRRKHEVNLYQHSHYNW